MLEICIDVRYLCLKKLLASPKSIILQAYDIVNAPLLPKGEGFIGKIIEYNFLLVVSTKTVMFCRYIFVHRSIGMNPKFNDGLTDYLLMGGSLTLVLCNIVVILSGYYFCYYRKKKRGKISI